jgi:hypothetical protein
MVRPVGNLIVSVLVLAVAGSAAWAAPITVGNPSFEDRTPALNDGDLTGAHAEPISVWTYSGAAWGAGLINPVPADLQATDGVHVLWSNGGSVSQTLADTALAGIYTLTVNVSEISGFSPSGYDVEFLVDGSPVGIATLPGLSNSTWQQASVVATLTVADVGKSLGIRLASDDAQTRFDSVAVDYVPEPASLSCLTLGAVAMLRRRR